MLNNSIPKIIFQTSKKRPKNYLINMIKNKCPGWTYIHFTDNDIINFFNRNYLDEFPNIVNKFNSIKNGAHKADLFRYYFIYIKGGVFLDSDAMIQRDLNYIIKDYNFFSVESKYYCPMCIFQGFLGAEPKNKIIYEALVDIYNMNINVLKNDYLIVCRNLYNILKKNWEYKIKIFSEIYGSNKVAITINELNEIILSHYFVDKIVPSQYFNKSHLLDNKRQIHKKHKKMLLAL
jgi:hypothetical protein